MSDDFRTDFVVELAPAEVWKRLTERTVAGDDDATHYVLAGFPSLEPLPLPGARCTELEADAERLLRVRKDHHPCAGTEIAITLASEGTGTRVTVVQSGFGAFLDIAGRDSVFGHGEQIVRDLRLYLERRLTVPGTAWGVPLGAVPRDVGSGLAIDRVDAGTWADRVGLAVGDLLLTVAGIRIHDVAQLATVLALIDPADEIELTWARGADVMRASAAPGGP